MIKITGLDEFQKTLSDAAEALKALDGQLATLKFNPNDPSSVEAAVIEMEQTIDTKIAPYRGNSIAENLVSQLKKRYQQEIYDRAAKARLQGDAS
jgi:putative salt-induced outer membrane protein YdiY